MSTTRLDISYTLMLLFSLNNPTLQAESFMTADVQVIDRQLRLVWRRIHQPQSETLDLVPPAASGTCSDAAPAFVQLGVVGADVIPYIPQSEERLAAELRGNRYLDTFCCGSS